MFFRINSPVIDKYNWNMWILHAANLYVQNYKIKPAECKLSNYLYKTYGYNLRAASCIILAHSTLQKNKSNEIIITFKDKLIDDLATIITYGNGKIQGSNILKEAFNRD